MPSTHACGFTIPLSASGDVAPQPCPFSTRVPVIEVDGRFLCLFHAPLVDAAGKPTEKLSIESFRQIANGMTVAFRKAVGGSVDLSGAILCQPDWNDQAWRAVLQSMPGVRYVGTHFLGPRSVAAELCDPEVRTWLKTDHAFPGAGWHAVDFTAACFDGPVNFEDCKFHDPVSFRWAQFACGARFSRASFFKELRFDGATFGESDVREGVAFRDCSFQDEAQFVETTFATGADFTASYFGKRTFFDSAHFQKTTAFERTAFIAPVSFANATFDGWAGFGTTRGAKVKPHDTPADTFEHVFFRTTRFHGTTDFGNRIFRQPAIFEDAEFARAPLFHGCDLQGGQTFRQAKFLPSATRPESQDDAALAFQTLKRLMESIRAWDEEARFFAFELRARRRQSRTARNERIMSALYDSFSAYGWSFSRPLAWLLCLTVLCWWGYVGIGLLAEPGWQWTLVGSRLDALTLTLQQLTQPFRIWSVPGHPADLPPWGDTLLAVRGLATIQSLLSITFITLFLFALRRRFRVH